MNYKVGDKVKIREDLLVGNNYDGYDFVRSMVKHKVVIINEVVDDEFYNVDESECAYTDEMIECLVPSTSTPISIEPLPKFVEGAPIREFSTGAVRDSGEGKPRMGLIPKDLERRLAKLYTKGAELYGADNWRKGQPKDATMDSLERHLEAYRRGETDEDHLSAVIWNAFSMMNVDEYLLEDHPELDFEFKYPIKKKSPSVQDVIAKYRKDNEIM